MLLTIELLEITGWFTIRCVEGSVLEFMMFVNISNRVKTRVGVNCYSLLVIGFGSPKIQIPSHRLLQFHIRNVFLE